MSQETIEKQLLAEYSLYDEHVDVVSAFEWLFTDVRDLAATVLHFERFPRISHPSGIILSPDFSVLFTDETGLVGEIAQIALHENSADKLCQQIGKYDELRSLPGPDGTQVPVRHLDILQLVQFRIGLSAVDRILRDRLKNPNHSYDPSKPPCIAQYSRDTSKYYFQRVPDVDNGELTVTDRQPNIGDYLKSDLAVPAAKFIKVKASRAFINDPVPALYLATHMWLRTIPTMFGQPRGDVRTSVADIADTIKSQYGHVRVSDVKRALDLLKKAGLADYEDMSKNWTISRALLGRRGEREVHQIIADRVARGARPAVRRARKNNRADGQQQALF